MTHTPSDVHLRLDLAGGDVSLVAPASSEAGLATWNQATFSGLRAMLGAQKADRIAQLFQEDLSTRFADPDDAGHNQRDAHVIASTAGMLGFDRLSRVAKTLEMAYLHKMDPLPALADLMLVRRDAMAALSSGHPEP